MKPPLARSFLASCSHIQGDTALQQHNGDTVAKIENFHAYLGRVFLRRYYDQLNRSLVRLAQLLIADFSTHENARQ